MSEYKYPAGYTPMTNDDHRAIFNARETFPDIELGLIYERAVLARLPKPDTADRDALVRRAVILAANSREFIPMHLISTESGKPYTSSGFRSMWHKAYSKAYPKDGTNRAAHQFTFNDLRAKAGSESMDWRILGHLDQKTFERVYNRLPRHVSPSR